MRLCSRMVVKKRKQEDDSADSEIKKKPKASLTDGKWQNNHKSTSKSNLKKTYTKRRLEWSSWSGSLTYLQYKHQDQHFGE